MKTLSMSKLLKKFFENGWIWFGIVAALIISLWLFTPSLIRKNVRDGDKKLLEPANNVGVFGDQYGSINALFSGLAFAALIVTLRLQMKELRQNTDELRTQARALDVQSELMRLSSELQALPVLIADAKNRIRTAASSEFQRFSESSYSIEDLRTTLASTEENFISHQTEILNLEEAIRSFEQSGAEYDGSGPNPVVLQDDLERTNRKLAELRTALPALRRLLAFSENLDATYERIRNIRTKVSS